MTHLTQAGHKAHERKVWQWGLDEPNRAARHAAWTGDNREQPRDANPHTRGATYAAAWQERAERFAEWVKRNPDKHHSENPFAAPDTLAAWETR